MLASLDLEVLGNSETERICGFLDVYHKEVK